MKKNTKFSALNLAYLFGGVILFGVGLSGLSTKDTRWLNWHFSRLGEGSGLSSIEFNITILISAVIVYFIGRDLSINIARLSQNHAVNAKKAQLIIGLAFNAIALCLVCLALFPFDRFSFVHDIFGYSMLYVFLGLCMLMQKILPIFSKRFYIYGDIVILLSAIIYTIFIKFRVITLLIFEGIVFILLYIWLLVFIKEISRKSSV
ncbi:MAG: hypothetical protein WCH58_03205 [Candidatus Saccharibacteria bacterium]